MDGSTATTYAPNPLNQYASIVTGGTPFTPLHDVDGNLVNDGIRTYQWDGENRLEEVRRVSDNALIARYSYDYMSRRVYKATTSAAPQGATATVFMYDGWNLLAEYPAIHRSIASTTPAKRTYTWGLDLSGSLQGAGGVGGLLAVEEKASTSGQVRDPLYDGNGNVIGVDDGISAAAVYEYDAFGNTVYQADGYADEMPFRFSTKYFDRETGFYYYGYRYYDPVTGRWPSRDPMGERGGVNLYGFTANKGPNKIDYLGKYEVDPKRLDDDDTGPKTWEYELIGWHITWKCRSKVEACCSGGKWEVFDANGRARRHTFFHYEHGYEGKGYENEFPPELIIPDSYSPPWDYGKYLSELSDAAYVEAFNATIDSLSVIKKSLGYRGCATKPAAEITCTGTWMKTGLLPDGHNHPVDHNNVTIDGGELDPPRSPSDKF